MAKNVQLRKEATDEFTQNLVKLIMNAIFSKTIENTKNQMNVNIYKDWRNAQKIIAKPTFKRVEIFSEDCVAVERSTNEVVYSKPLYAGFCILE